MYPLLSFNIIKLQARHIMHLVIIFFLLIAIVFLTVKSQTHSCKGLCRLIYVCYLLVCLEIQEKYGNRQVKEKGSRRGLCKHFEPIAKEKN